MAISKVQSVTGNGASLTLNGVASGNALTLQLTYLRFTTTGARAATPTDTNGTFTASAGDVNPLPAVFGGGDSGIGIWIEENTASGTHVVTPEADNIIHSSLCEFSGLATSSSLDVAKSASTVGGSQTSQVTGTTAATGQASELALICLNAGAAIGVANIGLTDPVTNYTTLQVLNDTNTDIGVMHNFRVLSSTGTQAATYNWTDNEANQVSIANIATFKAAAGAAPDQIWAEDASNQLAEEEELTIFDAAPPQDPDQIFVEDGALQPVEAEDELEVLGFVSDPLSANFPAQVDQFISYFPDEAEEPEQEWLTRDFSDYQFVNAQTDLFSLEDGSLQPVEPEESADVQGFDTSPLSPNAPVQSGVHSWRKGVSRTRDISH